MNTKTRKIIGWILTVILAVIYVGSAVFKLTAGDAMLQQATKMGFTAGAVKGLGVLQLICFALFVIPRTGIVGSLLLVAYLGGAIATHVQHNLPLTVPVAVEILVWITAAIRFPELTARLSGKINAQV